MSLVVFEEILDHTDGNYDGQGTEYDWFPISDGDGLNHLHDTDDQEVSVGQLGELEEQVQWEKREIRVLGGVDLVVGQGRIGKCRHDSSI